MHPLSGFLRIAFVSTGVFCLAVPAPLFAGGDAPRASDSTPHKVTEKTGTDVRGESGDFESYLNENKDSDKEPNSIELIDLGEDAKVAVGGDDSSLGLKMGY